ncbi:hypothetical protein [Hymenobacter siberiensis]|jgi:hypothetical protein|uniref:hypothetical protein n=1 Tax=Hymenobacter siberiensis TaxID=2848396 RepID=UPI001C1DD09C|nr:hypothetical protein [Hymenobacter siberiensis]
MAHFINHLVQAWGLSPVHYWHLRLLTPLLLTPLLGVLYVVLFDRPKRPTVGRRLWHQVGASLGKHVLQLCMRGLPGPTLRGRKLAGVSLGC